MKKILFSLVLGLSVISLFAQIPVSTVAENKNVVLEEYTGINCVYCPDGHRTAHDIQVAHPNDVVVIAIHQGGYATPGSGQPDFRTPFGDALASQYSISSYPNATVNRGASATSSRTTWTTWSDAILTESAYLNVGVEAQIDYATRILTVHCQVYYTGNSPVATNKLNIALLQNNVKGPQTGGSTYNPTMVTPDGQYMHQHMLRYLLTGQWGVTINNTNSATGTLKVDTTFTYTVPAAYTSIPVNLAQLEIAAFVSEGNKTIISGSRCLVNQPVNDLAVIGASNVPFMQCSTSPINPKVTIKNMGTSTLTSAVIDYSVDGAAAVSQNWTGSLAPGDTTSVILTNAITPTNGNHTVVFSASMANGVTDENDYDISSKTYNIIMNYSAVPVSEEFTSTAFPPTGWILDGPGWMRNNTSSFGTGTGSAEMPFFSIASGAISDMYIYGLDLTSGTGHYLSFDHAYAQYSATYIDKLQVQISSNCGTTWTTLLSKQAAALATNGGALLTTSFTPTASQWANNIINLTAYDGQSNLLIRFRATSGYGNNLYIDKVMTGINFGVNENNQSNVSVYPNPANDIINIVNAQNSTLKVYDMFGKLITSTEINNNNFVLNTSDLSAGNYMLQLTNGTSTTVQKIAIVK